MLERKAMVSGAGWAVSTASGADNTARDTVSEMVDCAKRASDTAAAVEAGSMAGGVDLLSSRYRSGDQSSGSLALTLRQ